MISFGLSVILLTATFVIYPLSTGAQISLYYMILNGAKLDLMKCISESKKKLINLVIGTFIYLFLTLMGLAAFIIPGIVIAVRLSFYCFLIMFENDQPVAALKKSYQITSKYAWQIANPLLAVTILIAVSHLLLREFFRTIGLYNLLFGIIIDSIFAILGWLSLILIFRFYCIYRDKDEIK